MKQKETEYKRKLAKHIEQKYTKNPTQEVFITELTKTILRVTDDIIHNNKKGTIQKLNKVAQDLIKKRKQLVQYQIDIRTELTEINKTKK